MKEVYADFNDFAGDGSLPLICRGSIASIAAQQEALTEGEEVWFTDGELRARGQVFRREDGWWEGRADRWVFVG